MIKKLLAALTIAVIPTMVYAWDGKSMNTSIDETNFLVNRNCSGTLLDKNTILTAAHCILDQYETVEKEIIEDGKVKKEKFQIVVPGTVSRQFYAGPAIIQTNNYVYKVTKTDRALDLALLKLQSDVSGKPAELACDDLTRGDTVYAVGNSFGVLYASLTKGIVSNINRSYRDLGISGQLGDSTDNGEHGLVQHSAPIAGGNSGGALYNDYGKFVGVNVRGAPTGGFSFSVPLSDVKSFLKGEIEDRCS